jgi:hypothetical protein
MIQFNRLNWRPRSGKTGWSRRGLAASGGNKRCVYCLRDILFSHRLLFLGARLDAAFIPIAPDQRAVEGLAAAGHEPQHEQVSASSIQPAGVGHGQVGK